MQDKQEYEGVGWYDYLLYDPITPLFLSHIQPQTQLSSPLLYFRDYSQWLGLPSLNNFSQILPNLYKLFQSTNSNNCAVRFIAERYASFEKIMSWKGVRVFPIQYKVNRKVNGQKGSKQINSKPTTTTTTIQNGLLVFPGSSQIAFLQTGLDNNLYKTSINISIRQLIAVYSQVYDTNHIAVRIKQGNGGDSKGVQNKGNNIKPHTTKSYILQFISSDSQVIVSTIRQLLAIQQTIKVTNNEQQQSDCDDSQSQEQFDSQNHNVSTTNKNSNNISKSNNNNNRHSVVQLSHDQLEQQIALAQSMLDVAPSLERFNTMILLLSQVQWGQGGRERGYYRIEQLLPFNSTQLHRLLKSNQSIPNNNNNLHLIFKNSIQSIDYVLIICKKSISEYIHISISDSLSINYESNNQSILSEQINIRIKQTYNQSFWYLVLLNGFSPSKFYQSFQVVLVLVNRISFI